MTRKEKYQRQVKKNVARLNSCSIHEFDCKEAIEKAKVTKDCLEEKFGVVLGNLRAPIFCRCKKCGGKMLLEHAYAYTLGVEAVREQMKQEEKESLPRPRRISQHYDGKNNIWSVWCYFDSEKNPCGCGSNCFHFEQDTKTGEVFGVCNACRTDIYQPNEDYKKTLLQRGSWF